jgi:hypothetical protein
MTRGSEDSGRQRAPFEKAILYFRIGMWVITIGVLVWFGVVYLQRQKRLRELPPTQPPAASTGVRGAQTDNNVEEVEHTIDTRTFQTVKGTEPKVAPVLPPSADNANAAAVLNSVRDRLPIEPQALYYLLGEVNRTSDNDFFMLRAPKVSLRQVVKDPDAWRGRPVTVTGWVERTGAAELPENPSGVRKVLEGEIITPDRTLCSFTSSRAVPLAKGRFVVIRGLFLKVVDTEDPSGRSQLAMAVVTRDVKPATPEAPSSTSTGGEAKGPFPLDWMIGIIVVLILLYFAMLVWARRRQAHFRERMEARRKQMRDAMEKRRREEEAERPQEEGSPESGDRDGQSG